MVPELDRLDPRNIPSNLLTLRRRLKLSQGELIGQYLLDEGGKPLISVATLSNMERGSVANAERVVRALAEAMRVDENVFYIDADAFAKNIDHFFESELSGEASAPIRARGTGGAEPLVRVLIDYLMDGLIKQKIQPGGMLPSDRQFSEMFGVGRSAVREALKVLNTLGVIQIFPGRGTFAASQSTDLFWAPLSWSFLLGERSIEHIVGVRNVLENESARLAALRADPAALGELADAFASMTQAHKAYDFQRFSDLDLDFHLAVARCSCNPIILNLLITSRKLLDYISRSGMTTIAHMDEIFEEHTGIYHAITAGESERAADMMNRHLTNAKARYQII